jgi:MerR family copper efflux transcriptional regulator
VGNGEKGRKRRIGELARAAGVSPDTLRHYERAGVLPAPRRSANGYREFAPDSLARVRLVRQALAVGFTLGELARVLKERDRGGAPCRAVRDLLSTKLAGLEEHLRALRRARTELRALTCDWDARLARVSPGRRAGLLDALSERPPIPSALKIPKRKGTP